jgi:hypothetical protein
MHTEDLCEQRLRARENMHTIATVGAGGGMKVGTHSFTIRVSSRPVTRPCCNTEVVMASFVPT